MQVRDSEILTTESKWLLKKFYFKANSNSGDEYQPGLWYPKKRYTAKATKPSKFRANNATRFSDIQVTYSDEFDPFFGNQPADIKYSVDYVLTKRRRGFMMKYLLQKNSGWKLADATRYIKTNLNQVDRTEFGPWLRRLLNEDKVLVQKIRIAACREKNATAMKLAATKFAAQQACNPEYFGYYDLLREKKKPLASPTPLLNQMPQRPTAYDILTVAAPQARLIPRAERSQAMKRPREEDDLLVEALERDMVRNSENYNEFINRLPMNRTGN